MGNKEQCCCSDALNNKPKCFLVSCVPPASPVFWLEVHQILNINWTSPARRCNPDCSSEMNLVYTLICQAGESRNLFTVRPQKTHLSHKYALSSSAPVESYPLSCVVLPNINSLHFYLEVQLLFLLLPRHDRYWIMSYCENTLSLTGPFSVFFSLFILNLRIEVFHGTLCILPKHL